MKMNMSARDKSLLILLAAVIVFYLCYTFIMTPALAMRELLTADLASARDQLVRVEELKGKEAELKQEEKQLKTELIKKYSGFFFDLKQSRLLNRMDQLIASAGLPAISYIPTPETASQAPVEKGAYTPLQYPLKDTADKLYPASSNEEQPGTEAVAPEGVADGNADTGTAEVVESEDMIPGTDVAIAFNGAGYQSIFNLIAAVEKMDKTVALKSVEIYQEEGGLKGQLIFSFYSLPKIDPDQKDGLDFVPAIPKGKTNPFQ